MSSLHKLGAVCALALFALALTVSGAVGASGGSGRTVTILVASQPAANKTVASGISSLGGTIRYRDDDVGYIRAKIDETKIDAVKQLSGVQAVERDSIIPLDDPTPEAAGDATDVAAPGPGTPAENAYMPTRDIGAPQFVGSHPGYDGRGVKVGILDTGVDLLTPELQTAKALDGTQTRKIVDWVTYTDPFDDDDPTWIDMSAQVSGSSFTFNNVAYTAPAAGTYRIGRFNERDPRLGGELRNDVNRDGNPAGSSGIFAVLWNATTNQVWVDTNQNASFADQSAMTDYKVNYDIGTFGTDNPATQVRETVPFVVQTDGKNKVVNIGIVSGAHGTHVAGIAAGKGFFNGAFNGAAPEAQIVSIRVCLFITGCTSHAMIEGMIFAEKQAGVDVINMSIGGLPALNDGNNTRAILYNRLIDQYKAQMFISAGNSGPGINTVGDPSVATKVMSIGAYVHADTWLSNYGAVAAKTDGMFVFSSRGPREDGGFKPNVSAPGSAVSTVPAWQSAAINGGCLGYTCPPGYAMFNGTSMASPEAAGGAALLISASKQAGTQYQPDQLRQAINSSARYLPAYGAHEQGNGLVQVGAAWDLLKTNVKTVSISSKAPVSTVLSGFLATPNYGQGIYLREGVAAGTSPGSKTITFTRTTGGSKAITYNLTWVGNDGTFSLGASSIALASNTPTNLTVNIGTVAAGVHSAILNVDDPATTGVDYQVLNTVVGASQFTVGNNFTVSQAGQADRPDKATFFYYVPANTPAFKVDLTGVSGRVRLLRFHPYGVGIDSAGYQTGGTQSRTLANPRAGVWEVTVDTSRTSTVTPATFTIAASILGVDISPTSWTVDPTTIGTPYNQLFTFTNRFGAFTGGAVGTDLDSAYSARPTIAAGAPDQEYHIAVPAGASSISSKIGRASDASADLDLFLYDCHTGTCVLKSQSTSGSAEESVSSANPAAGDWKVVVNPYAVPTGSTQYDYVDVYTKAGLGSVTITDPVAPHAYNASWTATATATALASSGTGRYLRGFVQVMSGSTLLGSAEVDLKNVTP